MYDEASDEPVLRMGEGEALENLQAVLRLCAAGGLRCSEKTLRPSAATVRLVAEHLVAGDFYPDEPIASFAWPLLLQAAGLAEIRLNPLGQYVLGLSETYSPPVREATQTLKVLPNHDVVAIGDLTPADRLTLSAPC